MTATGDDADDAADDGPPRDSGPRIARGPGSVVIGGANEAPITTNVTQHVRQFQLFGHRPRATVTEVADQLAADVQHQWSDEAARLKVGGEHRLLVRWSATPARVCATVAEARAWMIAHDPAALTGRGRRWATADSDLAGADLDLVDTWMIRSPTRRVVLLGEAGSGKSELMIRTLIALMARRAEFDGLVPVLIPAASWDSGDVATWLENWLIRNHRYLGEPAPGKAAGSYARVLLRAGRIALILDGFDELPPSRRAAFAARLGLELEVRPRQAVLLTSRPTEFSQVAYAGDAPGLGAAVGARLLPQRADEVIAYLRRGSLPESRWDGVAAAMAAGGHLAEVLETPLMVMLADTVYNTGLPQAREPRELLSFAGPKEIEQHLLDSYVTVRFSGERRWHLADVNRWLGRLASTLNSRTNSTDLTWWDLRAARTRAEGGLRRPHLFVLVATAGWSALSATTFNGWFYQDLRLGLVAGARVAAAAAICYLAVLLLTRNDRASLLAAAGAYIAGTVTAGYDLAVCAAVAGGFAWRPLVVRNARWWYSLAFGAAVATTGAVLQAESPKPSWTQGFGAGFVDGWSSRGDEVVNGWLLSCLTATMLLWAAIASAPRADGRGGPGSTVAGRLGPAGCGAVAALVVGLVNSWSDGTRPDVTHGWMIGPADGFAAGLAVWCLMSWFSARPDPPADTGVARPLERPPRRRLLRRARFAALGLGGLALVLNGAGYSARTDIGLPWCRAAAEALGVAVVAWYVLHPDRPAPGGRATGGAFGIAVAAAGTAVVAGCLDAMSAGWTRGVITGLSVGLVLLYTRLRLAFPRAAGTPVDAGMFAVVVVGLAAGFAYGLVLGVTFGLAFQVSRDVARRRFPSLGPRLSWPGVAGGAIMGAVVATAAGFNGIGSGWLVPIGLTSGAAAALGFGAQGRPVPDDVVMSPRRLLHLDRRTFVATLGIVAFSVALATGIRTMAQGGSTAAGVVAVLTTVITYGLTAGLLSAVAQSRYGAYLLWRLIHATRGQLPWRLMTFLASAHHRGVLRQNGANYQFRHQYLQDRLAQTARARSVSG